MRWSVTHPESKPASSAMTATDAKRSASSRAAVVRENQTDVRLAHEETLTNGWPATTQNCAPGNGNRTDRDGIRFESGANGTRDVLDTDVESTPDSTHGRPAPNERRAGVRSPHPVFAGSSVLGGTPALPNIVGRCSGQRRGGRGLGCTGRGRRGVGGHGPECRPRRSPTRVTSVRSPTTGRVRCRAAVISAGLLLNDGFRSAEAW